MLPLDGRTRLTTQLVRDADDSIRVEIHSRSVGGNWTRHAVARVEVAQQDAAAERPGSPPEDGTTASPADFYTAMRRTGAHHGQAFAALTRILRAPGSWAETEIVLPDEATPHRGILLHPVMLDAALQSLAAAMPTESFSDSTEVTYLPVAMESIRVFGEVGRRARCRAELVSIVDDSGDALGRVTLMDDTGTPYRGSHRRLRATRTTPNGAIAAVPEGFRHRMGGDSVDRPICRSRRLEAGWC